MSSPTPLVELEDALVRASRSIAPKARIFGAAFLAIIVSTVILTPPAHWTKATFYGLLISAVITALGQVWPDVPWQLLLDKVAEARGAHRADVLRAYRSGHTIGLMTSGPSAQSEQRRIPENPDPSDVQKPTSAQ